MIKTWSVGNFKSVAGRVSLDFAPLTIFAGANNSGKSTLIQSILLASQTLQSSAVSESVVLNGHIVRLGAFDDILSDGSAEDQVHVGFVLRPTETSLDVYGSYLRVPRRIRFRRGSAPLEGVEFECDFSFSADVRVSDSEVTQLHPRLDHCSLLVSELEDGSQQITRFHAVRSDRDPLEIASELSLEQSDLDLGDLNSLRFDLLEPTDSPRSGLYFGEPKGLAQGRLAGVTFRHFLPRHLVEIFDETEEYYRRLVVYLTGEDRYYPYRFRTPTDFTDLKVGSRFKDLVTAEFHRILADAEPSRPRYPKLKRSIERLEHHFTFENLDRSLSSLYVHQKRSLNFAFKEKATELYSASRGKKRSSYALRYQPLPREIDLTVDYFQDFFARSVKYLGPLRVEPKPIYSLPGAIDTKEIGITGEHTATVLDVHSGAEVEYVPSHAIQDSSFEPERESSTLLEATLDWLSYLGVASNVRTFDKGKIGRELKVTPSGGKILHDLIHVGVGVSQVLPIVVTALLSGPGSTLIFEQPELHLHPKVQTRLADFFLSMTYLGKQCVIETHSEYLIDRLRYRSAKSTGNEVSKRLVIYFVQKEKDRSEFNPIRINQYGVIENWPRGFFDEAENTSAEILQAGLDKRKNQGS